MPEPRVRAMLEEVLDVAARAARREADREAARPPARAVRHLVQRLPAARRVHRGGARRDHAASAIRPPRPTRPTCPNLLVELGFTKERAEYLAEQHRGRSGARLRPRARRRAAAATTRTCARASARTGWTTRATTSRSTRWATTSSRCSRSTTSTTTLLAGVPNTAFTEALAFVFQAHDLELLGLVEARRAEQARCRRSNDFWGTYEIAGVGARRHGRVALDVRPPDATPAELRERRSCRSRRTSGTSTTRRSSASEDVVLLGVYAHMIDNLLYLPDYPIGHLIAFQIEEQMREGRRTSAPEFERMARPAASRPTSG